jgi:hypothetical protein
MSDEYEAVGRKRIYKENRNAWKSYFKATLSAENATLAHLE